MWTQLRDETLPTSGALTHSRGLLSPGSRQELGLGRRVSTTKRLFGISIVLGAIPGTGDTAVSRREGNRDPGLKKETRQTLAAVIVMPRIKAR